MSAVSPCAPRLVVEVCGGPDAPRRVALAVGGRLQIGPGAAGELSLAEAAGEAVAHVVIAWDGARARMEVEPAGPPVLLGGSPCITGELADAAWLRVGDRDLVTYVEDVAAPTMSPAAARAHEVLGPLVGRLFAFVDPARLPALLDVLRHAVDEHASLYDGVQGAALVEVAPHLVQLRGDSLLLQRLLAVAWGGRATAYFTSQAPLAALRRHFRRFLWVRDEASGQRLYFRFHDPAVLRAYVSACTFEQAGRFFGPVESFHIEAPAGAVEHLRWPSRP
ncbi:DUF4123 domain-containing protein [Nannocystis radixulma]|uniref:DUF4123 domain-containing protein n=1 Tax=Nannocystis radixulma TaxID=2995305 RepID=A0ABT5B576_9BACT|nr:DUF4123 domain-containing protein [Nannocystis radixulma]MDC0669274.1 DUF4123 domain-containing protein [Nannocystis radixulma]